MELSKRAIEFQIGAAQVCDRGGWVCSAPRSSLFFAATQKRRLD
jgi:hypothetical protein